MTTKELYLFSYIFIYFLVYTQTHNVASETKLTKQHALEQKGFNDMV